MSRVLIIISFLFIYRTADNDQKTRQLYDEINLKNEIAFPVFDYAFQGYSKLSGIKKKNILTIIDFSKPSSEERLFIIDLENKELKMKSYVAHGKNSGENEATSFSNESRSLKSSLGFYLTAETYTGKHGYSLRLDGMEKGINSNARNRSIVIHGADYVSESFIEKYGRLGRSWGCPAVPSELSRQIIDEIAHGSCLFIYADDKEYLGASKLIHPILEKK